MNARRRRYVVRILWCFTIGMAMMAARAEAQVNGHAVLKTADYFQDTDNVPGSLSDVRVQPVLFTTAAGDITSASVTLPGASSAVDFVQHGTSWGLPAFNDTFFSLAAADSAYPNGGYLFQTAGGTAGTTSSTVQLKGTYPAAPVFTGTSLHDLATMNPLGPITITFNGFTPDPLLNDGTMSIVLVGPGGFQSFDPDVTATSFTFPAGTFQPASTYTVNLEYRNDDIQPGGQSDYSSYTQASITTASVPEPAGLALVGLGGAAAVRRRRARR